MAEYVKMADVSRNGTVRIGLRVGDVVVMTYLGYLDKRHKNTFMLYPERQLRETSVTIPGKHEVSIFDVKGK